MKRDNNNRTVFPIAKRVMVTVMIVIFILSCSLIAQGVNILRTVGDVNGDGDVTVTDFVQIKNHLLQNQLLSGSSTAAADLNGDGAITITDFLQMKTLLLNPEAVQAAKNAYTEYIVKNNGASAEFALYDAGDRWIALNRGSAVGVYESREESVAALNIEDKFVASGNDKLFVYGGESITPNLPESDKVEYSVNLSSNILTLTSNKGLNEVVTLPNIDPKLKFTKADMQSGVKLNTSLGTPDYADKSFYISFDLDHAGAALYLTTKDIPDGYYLYYWTYVYTENADGIVNQKYGQTVYAYTAAGARVCNQSTSAFADYESYAVTFCFSSDPNTLVPCEAPAGNWDILIHYGNTYTPTEYSYKIVDINGTGEYTSVETAVETEPENTVIVVLPGTYIVENGNYIDARTKNIILVGVDRDTCVLKSYDGRYDYPVIYGSCGYLANLTLYAEYVEGKSNEIGTSSGAYAFHCEKEYGVGKKLEFHNCTLISDFCPALGMGMRKDFTCIIDNCELISNQIVGRGPYTGYGSLGALYFHDSTGAKGKSYLIVKNSDLHSNLNNVICPYTLIGKYEGSENNTVYCTFINNTIEGEIWDRNGNAFEQNFVLTSESYGNTIDRLNYSN